MSYMSYTYDIRLARPRCNQAQHVAPNPLRNGWVWVWGASTGHAPQGALCQRCPPLPGTSPRFGTSLGPAALGPLRLAGSNATPPGFGNGFSPAMAGFPVFFFGMICPCLGRNALPGTTPGNERPQADADLSILRVLLGRRAAFRDRRSPLVAPSGGDQTVRSMTRALLCQGLHSATALPA
jgi:hypothetical protein